MLLLLGAGAGTLVVALMVVHLIRRSRRRRRTTAELATPPSTVAQAVGDAPAAEHVWQEPAPAVGPGSGHTVAAAVERALASRQAKAGGARGDARDRLLAVLLDDPVRAVGAAVELEACRRQLDRLTDAVRHERAALGDVLARLAAAGLDAEQLARLSGIPGDELRRLLPDDAGAR